MVSKTIVAVIPARGGSKGLPGKNIRVLGDKPLIAWTIHAAIVSNIFRDILVSTDNLDIADVAKKYGATIPFMRPSELSGDLVSQADVVKHIIHWMEELNNLPDYIMLLQPTSPLRTAEDIKNALNLTLTHNPDAIVSVVPASEHPYLAKKIGSDGILVDFIPYIDKPERRQEFPEAYILNGAIYLIRPKVFLENSSFTPPNTLGYIMPAKRSIDIDTLWDFTLAELILKYCRDDE